MATKKSLDDIFNDEDPFGLLEVKAPKTVLQTADDRMISRFEEINAFFEKYNREPMMNNGIQEHALAARLSDLRVTPEKKQALIEYDKFHLLQVDIKEINSLDDLIGDDEFGLLDDDSGLFDFVHVKRPDEQRASADSIARRQIATDFEQYDTLFKKVHAELKSGTRTFVDFKQGNLKEGAYYMHNGLIFLLEKVNISQKEHYKADGTRVREDGRTRCVFENGTESRMLKRSVEKILYANGKAITEPNDISIDTFDRNFSGVTESDQEGGFIYVLKSKSTKPGISELKHLYKIGYTAGTVAERIKNAAQEPTYLMSDVKEVMSFKCYNFDALKMESLLHAFFGEYCLDIEIFDTKGIKHTPREWFIAPLAIIEEAIHLMVNGEIANFRYDGVREEIVERHNLLN